MMDEHGGSPVALNMRVSTAFSSVRLLHVPFGSECMDLFFFKQTPLTVKISESIRLITPVLFPPLREGSDRKTVEQKIMYSFAPGMGPGLEPILPSGRLS